MFEVNDTGENYIDLLFTAKRGNKMNSNEMFAQFKTFQISNNWLSIEITGSNWIALG